jgi:sugar lactone lactonase YvrE
MGLRRQRTVPHPVKGDVTERAMTRTIVVGIVVLACLTVVPMETSREVSAQAIKAITVASEQTATGFAFPESVAYDPQARVLYVSQFGSELKPTEKDGKGRISKVALTGKIVEEQFLPAPGGVLNKPKGLWVEGDRLWVTDIDVVWVFDLKTRRGKKVDLPGIKFANDVTVLANVLYVSDNRADQLYRVEPADFLDKGDPRVAVVFSGKSVNPNGLYPARDGSLLMVGFMSPQQARGIYSLGGGGEIKVLAKELGRLDGVFELDDGTLLVTDWNSGSLSRWSATAGLQPLARGFKGPADFCVVSEAQGLMVVVPDLVKNELRMVRLAR